MVRKSWNDYSQDPGWDEADGPKAFYPLIGEVPTFTLDLTQNTRETREWGEILRYEIPSKPHMMHFIPLIHQGPYRITAKFIESYNEWTEALAEKGLVLPDSEQFMIPDDQWLEFERLEDDWRVDADGYVLCDAINSSNQLPCNRRAEHVTGYCKLHGNQLHPHNVKRDVKYVAPMKKRTLAEYTPEELEKLPRSKLWELGAITVEDLDDEELARGQFRDRRGKFVGKRAGVIPREMHDKFVNELFTRADIRLQQNLVDCVNTMVEVANSPVYEAKDRIKAAQWVFERVRGKQPDQVVHSQDKPWEGVLNHLTAVSGGSREESRMARQDPPLIPVEAQLANPTPQDDPPSSVVATQYDDPTHNTTHDHNDQTSHLAQQPTGMDPSAEKNVPKRGFAAKPGSSKDSQYEYTSISKVDDDGNDYDMVVAKPKKGSEAEAMKNKIKAQEAKRKKALKAMKERAIQEDE